MPYHPTSYRKKRMAVFQRQALSYLQSFERMVKVIRHSDSNSTEEYEEYISILFENPNVYSYIYPYLLN